MLEASQTKAAVEQRSTTAPGSQGWPTTGRFPGSPMLLPEPPAFPPTAAGGATSDRIMSAQPVSATANTPSVIHLFTSLSVCHAAPFSSKETTADVGERRQESRQFCGRPSRLLRSGGGVGG